MKKGAGKNKGGNFERLISKKLSEWYSDGKRDDLFYRTQSSGGRFTIRNKQGKMTEGQDGDIGSSSHESSLFSSIFSIECKHYKELSLWSFITGAKTGLTSFWEQTCNQARASSKIPILIARENYKPILFITDKIFAGKLLLEFMLLYRLSVHTFSELQDMHIYDFERDILTLDVKRFKFMLKKSK